MSNKEVLEKLRNRLWKFLESYQEELRHRVKVGNCLRLMEWAYYVGYKDAKLEENDN